MKIKEIPKGERPKEKCVLEGVKSLSNAELLALLINTGTRDLSAIDIASKILCLDEQGITYLNEVSIEELLSVDGIGEAKATRIMAALELGKRISTKPKERLSYVEDDVSVSNLFMEEIRYLNQETFRALLLDSKGGVISKETISIGELGSTAAGPREAFAMAIKRGAASVIFVHNHPSGDPTPSRQDIETTKRLVECGKILGIKVLDHIIIGDGSHTSLRNIGVIKNV